MKSRVADGFAEGVRLFNQARFFEAHEVWEEIWKKAPPGEKIFYQGLIQAAAALVHVQRGNYRGAVSLYFKARAEHGLEGEGFSWLHERMIDQTAMPNQFGAMNVRGHRGHESQSFENSRAFAREAILRVRFIDEPIIAA